MGKGRTQALTYTTDKKKHNQKLTIKSVEEAIPGTFGIYENIAQKLNVDRSTVFRFVQKREGLKELVTVESEKMVDNAENGLNSKINKGDITAIIFALKTKGKHRGYIERSELDIRQRVEYNVALDQQ